MAEGTGKGEHTAKKTGPVAKGCAVLIGAVALFGLTVGIIGIVERVTEDPEVQAQREAEAKAQREAEEAAKLAQGLHCVYGPQPEDFGVVLRCRICFLPAVDDAIKARLRAPSSYDGSVVAWSKQPDAQLELAFDQNFTAQNVYGATMDYHATGTFDPTTCKVTTVEIFEGSS